MVEGGEGVQCKMQSLESLLKVNGTVQLDCNIMLSLSLHSISPIATIFENYKIEINSNLIFLVKILTM